MIPRKCAEGVVPTRVSIGAMIFLACFIAYVIRVHMSINLIAMVKPDNSTNSTSQEAECTIINNSTRRYSGSTGTNVRKGFEDYGPRYEWDSNLQGLILGAFFWGYTISSLPAGTIAEKLGPKRTIVIASVISGTLVMFMPLTASWCAELVIMSRFIMGLVGGLYYPALQCLIAHWATPEERGKFVGALLGSSLGTVATWPVLGYVIESSGWNWAFYTPGLVILLWTAAWFYVVYDTPEDHPRISEKEKLYIMQNIGAKKVKGLPPYKDILISIPFWALAILQFGNLWGLFFLMTAGPKFMSSVLGFDLKSSGFFAALPYLARMVFGFVFGLIADNITKSKWMSTTTIRKSFVFFSHILPGAFLFIQTLTGCDLTWSIVLITLSLGMNGASSVTNLQNAQDLAPNYAGSLYGIATCLGGTSGFISPLIVGAITAKHNGLHEWHSIFYIGATVYVACAVIFIVFGSGKEQPWNTPTPEEGKSGLENAAYESTIEINKLGSGMKHEEKNNKNSINNATFETQDEAKNNKNGIDNTAFETTDDSIKMKTSQNDTF